MPPKKLKDLSQAPVYAMTHEQQVKLLSEALLREYMHRRGFHQTLKAFDTENPRNDETISSRALMSDLMVLQPEVQARLKEGGVETIMEMLCELRVERRLEVQRLREAAAAEVPEVPARYKELKAKQQARLAKKGGGAVSEDNSAASDDSEDERETKAKKDKKEKKAKKKKEAKKKEGAPASAWASDGLVGDAHMTIEDLLGSSTSTQEEDANNNNSNSDDSEDETTTQTGAAAAGVAPDWLAARRGSGGGGASAAGAAAAPKAAPSPAAAAAVPAAPVEGAEELDEEELAAGVEGDAIFPGSQGLPAEMGQAAYRTICGASAAPPVSFLQQGFTFDEVLEYAMIQWREGPSGILAAVQAFVIAYYFEKELYVDVATRQRLCLRRALLTMLSKAQPQPRHIVLVHGLLAKHNPERTAHARLAESSAVTPYMSYWTGFNTTEEVDACLDALLTAKGGWGAAKGSGLWCFLLSLVLSRGNAAVGKDMDEPAHPLLQGRAESTLELANLCLTGRATSNTCNHAGSSSHKGYIATLACGLLRAEDVGGGAGAEAEDGEGAKRYTFATDSTYPSWVIYDVKKGRFSNIFMKKDVRKVFQQKKALGGGASIDFIYWDCATEDDEVELSVVVTGAGSWGGNSRKIGANSFVAKAILAVPLWADGSVDWKGNTPVH